MKTFQMICDLITIFAMLVLIYVMLKDEWYFRQTQYIREGRWDKVSKRLRKMK